MSARASIGLSSSWRISTGSGLLPRTFSTKATQPRQLRKRAVVGSFLFRLQDDGSPAVALFQRSDKVTTYKHKFAAISGGVEPEDASPRHAALRELREETGLTEDSLQLICRGMPYSFVDSRENYEWSVYPFAFRWPSTAREQLKLGWDHQGYAWFRPHEIRESDVASGVIESLGRVWPVGALGRVEVLCRYCLGEKPSAGIETDARRDPVEALAVFCQTIAELKTRDAGEWRRQAHLAAWHVSNCSDATIRGALLARLLGGLDLLEQLLGSQGGELAPEFERLAASALESVDERGGSRLQDSEENLTQKADRIFSKLWEPS